MYSVNNSHVNRYIIVNGVAFNMPAKKYEIDVIKALCQLIWRVFANNYTFVTTERDRPNENEFKLEAGMVFHAPASKAKKIYIKHSTFTTKSSLDPYFSYAWDKRAHYEPITSRICVFNCMRCILRNYDFVKLRLN